MLFFFFFLNCLLLLVFACCLLLLLFLLLFPGFTDDDLWSVFVGLLFFVVVDLWIFFVGSVDGIRWSMLRRHTGDHSLVKPFDTHTWQVPGMSTAYQFFRVLQIGHNSSNHNFLVLSGLEFFGRLYDEGHGT